MSTPVEVPEVLSSRLIVHGRAGLRELLGSEVVLDAWHLLTQESVDAYETASGEPHSAGQPVVPGFLTLGLTVKLFFDTIDLRGFAGFVNYGVNRMRLPNQLRVGESVRARIKFVELRDFPLWVDLTTQLTFERDGGEKPACWVEWVGRGYETRTRPAAGCEV
jgi:hypothetical protein